MIYNKNYFFKEFRHSYLEERISARKMIAFGVFLGLLAFALHFMLQTVYESVLTQKVPEIMTPSYFSVIFVYVIISFLFFIIYFLVNYKYLTFNEIARNKWYALVKMGYKPFSMILNKILAVLFSSAIIYTVGFAISLLMTAFLKYYFVFKYLPSLYIAGLIDVLLIIFITMSGSIFIKQEGNARYFTLAAAVLMFGCKLQTGYYQIMSNRILMQDFSNLFKSLYLPIMGVVFVICIISCLFGAKYTSHYYWSLQAPNKNVVVKNFKTHSFEKIKTKKAEKTYKVFDFVFYLGLTAFILLALAFNAFVLAVSVSQPGREVTIRGVIPYVFQSTSMQPTIDKNDLTYFKKIDVQYPLKKGDVVLFKENNKVYVERIIEINDEEITVDIDYYPPMSQVGAMVKKINRSDIYGLYFDRNRWLGALILFANTIFGRILFLLIPSVLIFFYKPIVDTVKKWL